MQNLPKNQIRTLEKNINSQNQRLKTTEGINVPHKLANSLSPIRRFQQYNGNLSHSGTYFTNKQINSSIHRNNNNNQSLNHFRTKKIDAVPYIKVNFIKNLGNGQKRIDTQIKYLSLSPASKINQPQAQIFGQMVKDLQRKCKILQSRIQQLHIQNNNRFLKLNEQNRNIFYEKQELKKMLTLVQEELKIKNLQSIIEIGKNKIENDQITQQLFTSQNYYSINHQEFKKIKDQKEELQSMIEDQMKKKLQFKNLNQEFKISIQKLQNEKKQIQILKENLDQKIQSFQLTIKQLLIDKQKNQLVIKQYQQIIDSIKNQIYQSYQRNEEIVNKYELKLKQMKEQMNQFLNDKQLKKNQFENYQQLQKMKQAIVVYEENINELKQHILILQSDNKRKVLEFEHQLEQNNKLSIALNMKQKNQDELKQQIDIINSKKIEKQSNLKVMNSKKNSSNLFEQVESQCKKCQQLLKTVFKLNQYLNKQSSI